MAKAMVGIIGGSGMGEALASTEGKAERVRTPFGEPSDLIVLANWHGTDIAILNRHGPGHALSPSTVNYRANIYALKALGCTHVIASGAVGLAAGGDSPAGPGHPRPGDRQDLAAAAATFFEEHFAAHVEIGPPVLPGAAGAPARAAPAAFTPSVHDGGTYVCMEGPAFSTRAESEMHRSWGGDLIGMTVHARGQARPRGRDGLRHGLPAQRLRLLAARPGDPGQARTAQGDHRQPHRRPRANAIELIKVGRQPLRRRRRETLAPPTAPWNWPSGPTANAWTSRRRRRRTGCWSRNTCRATTSTDCGPGWRWRWGPRARRGA